MADPTKAPGVEHGTEDLDRFEVDPRLIASGWRYRFVAAGQRLREMVNLYESLGFEVRLEPVRPVDENEDCRDCQIVTMLQFQSVYTRQRDAAEAADKDAAGS